MESVEIGMWIKTLFFFFMCGYGYVDIWIYFLSSFLTPFDPFDSFFVCVLALVFLGVWFRTSCSRVVSRCVRLCSREYGIRDVGKGFTLFYVIIFYFILFFNGISVLISICSTSFFPCVPLLSNFSLVVPTFNTPLSLLTPSRITDRMGCSVINGQYGQCGRQGRYGDNVDGISGY